MFYFTGCNMQVSFAIFSQLRESGPWERGYFAVKIEPLDGIQTNLSFTLCC